MFYFCAFQIYFDLMTIGITFMVTMTFHKQFTQFINVTNNIFFLNYFLQNYK